MSTTKIIHDLCLSTALVDAEQQALVTTLIVRKYEAAHILAVVLQALGTALVIASFRHNPMVVEQQTLRPCG